MERQTQSGTSKSSMQVAYTGGQNFWEPLVGTLQTIIALMPIGSPVTDDFPLRDMQDPDGLFKDKTFVKTVDTVTHYGGTSFVITTQLVLEQVFST